jgi:hypothetical protein
MYNITMKSGVLLLIMVGILFVIPHMQMVYPQTSILDQMITHMRFTHSQLTNNIDEVKQLVESNNTAEALNLLDGMDAKINHMNSMFNDLVWELSNKGH